MRERCAQAEPTECVQRSLASQREGFHHRRCQGPWRGSGLQNLATRDQPEGRRSCRGRVFSWLWWCSSKRC